MLQTPTILVLLLVTCQAGAQQISYELPTDDPNWESSPLIRADRQFGEDNRELATDSTGDYLRIHYPAGTSVPSAGDDGGTQFLVDLQSLNNSSGYDVGTLSYDLRFATDFPWDGDSPPLVTGKLPGLYGGSLISGGGITSDGTNGVSTRYQWREGGQGEVKAYIPNPPGNNFAPAFGDDNPNFLFQDDFAWHNVTQHIELNTIDGSTVYADGVMNVWIDGLLVINETDLIYRTVDTLELEGIFFSTFFGGNGEDWATPVDTTIDFRNIVFTAPVSSTVPEAGTFSLLLLASLTALRFRRRRS